MELSLLHCPSSVSHSATNCNAEMEQAAATACDGIGWAAGALGTGTSRSYSPTSGRRGRDAEQVFYLDASAMPPAATRWRWAIPPAATRWCWAIPAASERKPKRQFEVLRCVCGPRGIRNWKATIVSTSSNLDLVFHRMGCKFMKLKPPILLYTKVCFIF